MGLSRQGYWRDSHSLLQGIFQTQGSYNWSLSNSLSLFDNCTFAHKSLEWLEIYFKNKQTNKQKHDIKTFHLLSCCCSCHLPLLVITLCLICTVGKESTCNAGDPGSIPESGRPTGEGRGYPLQYSGLENSMDCTVHGVTELDMSEQPALICIIHPTSQTWHLCCISLNDYIIKQTNTNQHLKKTILICSKTPALPEDLGEESHNLQKCEIFLKSRMVLSSNSDFEAP